MSTPRITRPHSLSCYHVFSRIVDKQFLFRESEKRFFYYWMRTLEKFSGVQVVTYCLMSNHFHLLVRVPRKDDMPMLTEDGLRRLLPLIYSGQSLRTALQELDRAATASAEGNDRWLGELLARYHARRYDLSSFVKDLKQRFTQWYNSRHERCGTLWESNFGSVLVESSDNVLLTMAAYIDLNPVRAGLVNDPKNYRWSGYGEAVAGKVTARRGLSIILEHSDRFPTGKLTWAMTGPRYRRMLYEHGEERDISDLTPACQHRKGLSRKAVTEVKKRDGQLPLAAVLRSRVRYFCAGAIFGSGEFIDEVFEKISGNAKRKRNTGARRMKGGHWGDLRVLRDLQKNVS